MTVGRQIGVQADAAVLFSSSSFLLDAITLTSFSMIFTRYSSMYVDVESMYVLSVGQYIQPLRKRWWMKLCVLNGDLS